MLQLEAGYTTMAKQLAENTRVTCDIKADTADLLDLFKGARTGIRVVLWLAKAAKWIAALAASIGAIWYFIWAIVTHHPPLPK